MLGIAAQKGFYRNVYQELLREDEPSQMIPARSYDAVIGSGIFGPAHMSPKHLKALSAAAKVFIDWCILFTEMHGRQLLKCTEGYH